MTPNLERLSLLADRLEQIAITPFEKRERQFDLRHWWLEGCGTAACAIGEATEMPAFRRLGLERICDIYSGYVPKYKRFSHWEAVEQFFGLSTYGAELLFCASNYDLNEKRDPAAVASRIRDLIALAAASEMEVA